MKMDELRVPTREDWGDLKDLDVAYAYRAFGGKTIEEAIPLFIGSEEGALERSSELRFAPAKIFNYYVLCFIDFLTSDKSKGCSDTASTFLLLIPDRLNAPGASEIANTVLHIKPAIDKVAGRQTFYKAPVKIYGSFLSIKNTIDETLLRFEGNR